MKDKTTITVPIETRKRLKRVASIVDKQYSEVIDLALDVYEEHLQRGGSENDWERNHRS